MHRGAITGLVMLVLCAPMAHGQGKHPSAQPEERRLRCHDPHIRLEGTLVRRWFYGPPGFGETPKRDARDEVFVLKLTHPVTVAGPSNPTRDETCADELAHMTQVQVWTFPEHKEQIRDNIGKSVVITGTLDEDPAPGAHIDVQITPELIEAN